MLSLAVTTARLLESPAPGTSSDQLQIVSAKESQSMGTQYSMLDSENENSTDISGVVYTAFPQDAWKMHRALLKRQTDKIRMKYSSLKNSFLKHFLEREKSGDVNFNKLYSCAIDVFDLEDHEYMKFKEDRNCEQLMMKLFEQQNYVNFDKLTHLITQCGTQKDEASAQKYTEDYKHYAKQRVFDYDPDLISTESISNDRVVFASDEKFPGHYKAMFVLGKAPSSFQFADADEYKLCVCEMIGMSYHEFIVVRFIRSSIAIVALIPRKYFHSLTNIPLYLDKVLTLKKWNTLRIGLNKQEIISLSNLNLLDDVKFDEGSIVEGENVSVLPVDVSGTKCMALEYTACYHNEDSADRGYVEYMERFLSGKHSNLPALKGVYYHPESKDTDRHYPVIVVERLKSLRDICIEKEVDQVSVLSDVVSSVTSFGSDHVKCKVVPDAIFVRDSSSDIQARFCPLYGHSYVSNQSQALVPHTPIPLGELLWMDELVKFIHFKGNVPDKSELPENHVLKKMLEQRWLCKEGRFRPQNLEKLSEELHQLVGKICMFMCRSVSYFIYLLA